MLHSLSSTDEQEALEISLGTLGRTPDGRNATLETRLAMQRELDAARSQLRASERTCDDLRRQAVASREEVSLFGHNGYFIDGSFIIANITTGRRLSL